MKNHIVRVNGAAEFPRASYVKTVGRDGGFSITFQRTEARLFAPETAREICARLVALGKTRMTFEALEVTP